MLSSDKNLAKQVYEGCQYTGSQIGAEKEVCWLLEITEAVRRTEKINKEIDMICLPGKST